MQYMQRYAFLLGWFLHMVCIQNHATLLNLTSTNQNSQFGPIQMCVHAFWCTINFQINHQVTDNCTLVNRIPYYQKFPIESNSHFRIAVSCTVCEIRQWKHSMVYGLWFRPMGLHDYSHIVTRVAIMWLPWAKLLIILNTRNQQPVFGPYFCSGLF